MKDCESDELIGMLLDFEEARMIDAFRNFKERQAASKIPNELFCWRSSPPAGATKDEATAEASPPQGVK